MWDRMETGMYGLTQGSNTGWRRGFWALLAAGIVASCAVAGSADAAPRKKKATTPDEHSLTIKRKRGFLESGNVVPLGSQSNYVGEGNRGASGSYSHTGAFGSEALPRRFDVPQSGPLFQF